MPSSAVRTFSDPEEQAAWSVQTQDYEIARPADPRLLRNPRCIQV